MTPCILFINSALGRIDGKVKLVEFNTNWNLFLLIDSAPIQIHVHEAPPPQFTIVQLELV